MSIKKMESVQNIFGSKLRDIRKQRNISVDELANIINISTSYIYKIESNSVDEIAPRTAESLQNWIDSVNKPESVISKVKLIPVYATVPAGWPSDCHVSEEPIGYVPFEGNGRNMGALLVDGHSMSPDIKDGEYVVYVEDYNIKPGDRVVALNEFNKPMVKEYAVKDGEPWLVSTNPEYGNHKVNEHYRIIGRVIEAYNKRKIGRG